MQQFLLDHLNGLPKHIDEQLTAQKLKIQLGTLKVMTIRRYLASLLTHQQEHGHDTILGQPAIRMLFNNVSHLSLQAN